jgi:RNase H-fold protein (predicted Holliday junction resolvase)
MPAKSKHKSQSSKEKVQAYRDRLRKQGLRPIQIWVPDTRAPSFKAEAKRQSLAAANSLNAKKDQDFVNAISIWNELD